MRTSIMLELQEGATWERVRQVAVATEQHGFEALHVSDHYAPVFAAQPRGSLETWAVLAALAATTRRLRLGPMVSPVTFRPPSVLAGLATAVDHISGGRVELGVGAGWWERDHLAYGFDFPEMATRLELLAEQVEVIVRLWTDERFDFEGRHYRLEGCSDLPAPIQQPHPTLIIAGSARSGTTDLAARYANEYNTPAAPPEELQARRRRLDAACERAERDPASLPMSVAVPVIVGATEGDVERRARTVIETVSSIFSDVRTTEDARARWIVGTPDEAVERVAELERVGARRLVLQLHDLDDLEPIELLGEAVLPSLERP